MSKEKAGEYRDIKPMSESKERGFYNKERERSDMEVEENYESWISG